MAQLYDVISRSATLGPVDVEPYLNGIAGNLRSSLPGEGSGIIVEVEAEPLAIGADHAVSFGLIVNELATNAVKYAFPYAAGRITIGFGERMGDLVLTISDDGVGLGAPANPDSAGLGTRFVEAFAKQLGGSLAVASGQGGGTTFTVRMPRSILG